MKSNAIVLTAMGLIVGLVQISELVKPVNAQVLEDQAVNVGTGLTEIQANSKISEKKISSSKPLLLPVYKPPKGIGAPGGRVGGGTRGGDIATRGDDAALLMLFALVPDHLGLTIQEQPALYWYLSKDAPYRLVLTLNHEDLVKPVLELTLAEKVTPGIHSVNLKDHNIRLELDKEYRWFVGLVVNADYPSRNIVAGGRIKRIVPPEPLLAKLRKAEPQEVTSVYSQAGLWYDAFASISDLIEANSENNIYVNGRVGLLQQVDLMEVAEAEESVALIGDSTNLYNEYMDEPFVGAFVEHQLQE